MEPNQFDKEAIIAWQKRNNDIMIWGGLMDNRTDYEKWKDDLRMGMVKIDGDQHMLKMDQKTMKAYKTGDWYSLVEPVEEIKYDSFDRWCRGMDF